MKKIFFTIIASILIFGCSIKEEVTFILPEGYVGYVIIIYDQKDGEKVKYDGSTRVYEIPSSGILKTQFSADYGWSDFPKFYYNNNDSEEIVYFYDFDQIPSGKIVSYGNTTGTANKDLKGDFTVNFSKHYIGTKEQIESAIEKTKSFDYVKLADE
jgi:asparagine N-glycosylation enzyme membrane subunit Stt3